jgi:peptidyl-prolyl cis-trans isomerase SDCCAG10
VLATTMGDIDIELVRRASACARARECADVAAARRGPQWPKEAPLATRNFAQLCLEGYFNGCVFHRVARGFIAQTGDPTGTGSGGESVFGRPFEDEFHSRLRFSHRGLVAMAGDAPNSNRSQFFITLAPCEFLNRKHTIFGRVVGNTLYNVDALGAVPVDADERPLHPPRIVRADVVTLPFDDIVPRALPQQRQEKGEGLQQQQGGETRKAARRAAPKNKALLSFAGEEGEEGEEEEEEKEEAADAGRGIDGREADAGPPSAAAAETRAAFAAAAARTQRQAPPPPPPPPPPPQHAGADAGRRPERPRREEKEKEEEAEAVKESVSGPSLAAQLRQGYRPRGAAGKKRDAEVRRDVRV